MSPTPSFFGGPGSCLPDRPKTSAGPPRTRRDLAVPTVGTKDCRGPLGCLRGGRGGPRHTRVGWPEVEERGSPPPYPQWRAASGTEPSVTPVSPSKLPDDATEILSPRETTLSLPLWTSGGNEAGVHTSGSFRTSQGPPGGGRVPWAVQRGRRPLWCTPTSTTPARSSTRRPPDPGTRPVGRGVGGLHPTHTYRDGRDYPKPRQSAVLGVPAPVSVGVLVGGGRTRGFRHQIRLDLYRICLS